MDLEQNNYKLLVWNVGVKKGMPSSCVNSDHTLCLSFQGHHVACVHRRAVSGRERQPAVGRPARDRILDLQVVAVTGTSGGSEARGCRSFASRTETITHLCPSWQLSLCHGRLPPAPAPRAAGCGRLSAGPQLCPVRAQGKEKHRVLALVDTPW